jgi:DNA mismatch repair protein MutS2
MIFYPMDDRSLTSLEFPLIRDLVKGEAQTPLGQERALSLAPLETREMVKQALQETGEAQDLLLRGEDPSLGGVSDIRSAFTRANVEGAYLEPHALWEIYETMTAAGRLRVFFHRQREAAPLLWRRASQILPPEPLLTLISEAITPEGDVADSASPGLHGVRRELQTLREAILAKLERYLTTPAYQTALAEPIITIRNDRYVIPVKSSARTKIRGIVQDQSGSGLTLFLEPAPVVEMNNRYRILLRQEGEEVVKVLQRLTAAVRKEAELLQSTLEVLGDLDFILAKARLASRLKAAIPKVGDGHRMILRQARHPFLALRAEGGAGVVPIDIEVGGDFATVVITGPNTGGKTVALKTAGLLALMTLSGLPVPASPDSEIPCYRAIFADIGDEQSIAQSLSTFSSHMGQIVKILEQAGPRVLVLLDELGAGTDPSEGGALGMAILGALREHGASVIATTHLEAIKAFAALTPGMQNASVEFDLEHLTPLYRVRLGLPGKSYGLEIAGRLGLSSSLLERARTFLTEGERKTQELLETLEVDRRQMEGLKAELEKERERASKLSGQLEQLWMALREEVKVLRKQAREEAKALLLDIRREGERLLQDLRSREGRKDFYQTLGELKGKLPEAEPAAADDPKGSGVIEPGQWVRIPGLNQEGRVLTPPSPQGTVEVQLKVGKVRVPISELLPMKPALGSGAPVPIFIEREAEFSPEISLIGCTVEEAEGRLAKYLDTAFFHGLRRVRIIHGKGTGVLRKGIHEFLKTCPLVEGFYLAELREGGSGATVVQVHSQSS